MVYSIESISSIIGAKKQDLHRGFVSHLLTDSRRLSFPERSLFFAIKTKSNNGHKFIEELYNFGVRNFVVSEETFNNELFPNANFLVVKNTVDALQTLAAYHRAQFDYPVIGITGSNGKTVTKELLFQLLHGDDFIVRSPRSYNSQIGVPLSVWEMNAHHTLGVFEAGISQPDEMARLRKIIMPTIGVLTNIGEAHQENFVSFKEKCVEKLSLFVDSECIIYCKDDELITDTIGEMGLSQKAWEWSRNDVSAHLYIESILKSSQSTEIRFVFRGVGYTCAIPFTDDAFTEDVIHCIAVISYMKPAFFTERCRAFVGLEPVAMRLETKEGINGCQLINDTYNSDIQSLGIALDFQQNRRAGKNFKSTVILSDILQSGLEPEDLYAKVAELMSRKHIDRLIGIGKDMSTHGYLFEGMECEFYRTTEDFIGCIKAETFDNEIILLKGSRVFHFEKIAELLEKKVHQTVLEVNLDAIIHNYNYFRSLLNPQTKMVCMVKAFGYGIGSSELAKTLQEQRCDYLAVAVADEGKDLRKDGIFIPIMVMNPEFSSFNLLFDYMLEPEIYSFRLLDALLKEVERRGVTFFPVHIKIDTGMHRLGFAPEDIPEVCRYLRTQNGIIVRSAFSHLVGGDSSQYDDYTKQQLNIFAKTVSQLEQGLGYTIVKHILNSAGIERFGAYQYDMVRLGISLYGISASGESKSLQCVCALKTVILQIRHVAIGETVGYGRKTTLQRDSRIAVIPIGYADGLDRHLSNGVGEVLIKSIRCKILGNICMDTCMVDITDTDAQEGDEVVVFNENLTVGEMAEKLGTIPYEILTSISPRVKRVYYRE